MSAVYDAIKWYIMSALLVGGFFFVNMADARNSFKPLMPALLMFGGLFIAAYVWHKYDRKVQLLSLVTVIVTAALAYYLPDVIYIATGAIYDVSIWLSWFGLNFVLGVPFMFSLFK
jgi:hypothetical protein